MIRILTCAVLGCMLTFSAAAAEPSTILYVSPAGDDVSTGTVLRPFATLARARDAIRELRISGTRGPVTVYLRGGMYRISDTVVFGPEDSQRNGDTVTYAAYPGETPVLSGGVPVTGWRRLTDEPAEVSWRAHGRLWVAEIPRSLRGTGFKTLYDSAGGLPRARSAGTKPTTPRGGRLASPDSLYYYHGDLRAWPNLADIELLVLPSFAFTMNILGLADVDESRNAARTTVPASYPLKQLVFEDSRNLWIENALEYLDDPGEWVVDSAAGLVYLWPRDGVPTSDIVAPGLIELVRVDGGGETVRPVENLAFSGLTFTHGDRYTIGPDDIGLQHDWELYDDATALLRIRGAEGITVEGCRFTDSGGTAVRLDLHCREIDIVGNTIEHVGACGVLLSGFGPGIRDENRDNTVTDNVISFSGEQYWQSPAIFVWQSGDNEISHNRIHHIPYVGIVVSGPRPAFVTRKGREQYPTIRHDEIGEIDDWDDFMPFLHARNNMVAYNELYRVMEVMSDGNAIYVSGAGEGNVVSRNYVHDIYGKGAHTALRADDFQRGTLYEENVVHHCVMGGFTLKHHNDVINNYFIDILDTTDDANYRRVSPYGYMLLRRGPSDGARVQRNIFYHPGGETTFLFDTPMPGKIPSIMVETLDMDRNCWFAAEAPGWSATVLDSLRLKGVEKNGIAADPLFVSLKDGDFRLREDSPALKAGIRSIDISGVGPRR
jgi:hypothetical protein